MYLINLFVRESIKLLQSSISYNLSCYVFSIAGAINDYIVGKIELAKYFLSVLNRSDEYKKWEKFTAIGNINNENEASASSHMERSRRRQNDHTQVTEASGLFKMCNSLSTISTGDSVSNLERVQYGTVDRSPVCVYLCLLQDFIVNDVRGALYNAVSSFNGDLENEEDLLELIEAEFSKLRNAFRIGLQSAAEEHDDDRRHSSSSKVAIKLLDLYRTGRLGHYILDSSIPS